MGLIPSFRTLRNTILGVTGAAAGLVAIWNKEAAAQSRIDSALKANVRNYRAAQKELAKIISLTQRTTNFGDDDIRDLFGAFLKTTGGQGFGLARRFTPTLLDFASQFGENPTQLAEYIGRAIATGQTSLLERQGIIIDKRAFKRDRAGAIFEALSSRTNPNAAEDARRANPFQALMNNVGDVLEGFGSVLAQVVNPAMERLAQHAQNFAESFDPNNIAQYWEEAKRYAADAWDKTRILAGVTFEFIGYKMGQWLESVQGQISNWFKSNVFNIGAGASGGNSGGRNIPFINWGPAKADRDLGQIEDWIAQNIPWLMPRDKNGNPRQFRTNRGGAMTPVSSSGGASPGGTPFNRNNINKGVNGSQSPIPGVNTGAIPAAFSAADEIGALGGAPADGFDFDARLREKGFYSGAISDALRGAFKPKPPEQQAPARRRSLFRGYGNVNFSGQMNQLAALNYVGFGGNLEDLTRSGIDLSGPSPYSQQQVSDLVMAQKRNDVLASIPAGPKREQAANWYQWNYVNEIRRRNDVAAAERTRGALVPAY